MMRKTGCIILVFRNLRYYIKNASSSFVRNGIMTFASFITVTCCLFLFGVFLMFTSNLSYITNQIESQCEIQAYLGSEASVQTQQNAFNAILSLENVSDAAIETKEQAFKNFKDQLGENSDVLEGVEADEFLRTSIKVSLKDIRKSDDTAKRIEKITGIETVKNRQDIVNKVVRFTGVVNKGSLIAMFILLVIAVFIIQNTIKLSVYAREEEVHIMKFVGATDRFIRMPFVIEGIMIGTLGFIVSYTVIALGYNAAISSIENLIQLFEFLPIQKCALPLALSMAAFGIFMGAAGSGISLKRYLKV